MADFTIRCISGFYKGRSLFSSSSLVTENHQRTDVYFPALRICTGSMKSASLASLQVEMGEERRKSLIAKSYCKESKIC